jgi:hypothetical protein
MTPQTRNSKALDADDAVLMARFLLAGNSAGTNQLRKPEAGPESHWRLRHKSKFGRFVDGDD